jgi:hypothetical protein
MSLRRRERKLKIHKALLTILIAVVVALSLIASYRLMSIESTITLLIFNFLFISLIFQLKGTLAKKTLILATGNLVGFLCNFVFFNFSYAGLNLFGEQFKVVYTFLFPFLNLFWIVPFWSFSLSFFVDSNVT